MVSPPPVHFGRDVSRYKVGGYRVPSVTEALAIAGLIDFSGVPERILEAAAERGRLAHHVTALIDRGEDTGRITNEIQPYVAAYEKFRADTHFYPKLIEETVVSTKYLFAGTLDRFGWLNGEPALIDLKTSSQIARWIGLQLAGYAIALEEQMGEITNLKRFALRLHAEGTYSLHRFRSASDRADFLAAVRIANYQLREGGVVL